ncbi:NrfD/PsrC family molybdoenzyme membrane anchor subunit [Spiribacter roseus]|uniref:NrfD/PsrC family molybdoenzyme membrane anchor subunit n=1 Tax=Spiribacter roseus TaxID=1855875 RepID=UPI00132FA4F8|nr:NrfD/PsrC family molybdoenzyme membrane anchor subunit [Spiribacter roseus]KAF0281077.1 hypothetical protein BA900_00605 [Spiribacter roseus]
MNIAEIIVPQQEVSWLPWAVQYFFLVGMAATAAILVAIGEFVRGGRWQRLQAPALVVAISTGVIAPIALLADLHQPGRFYHFYTDITPWSWMSLGALILPVFMTGLLGYWVLWQRAVFKAEGAPRWLALWAAGNWSGQALRPWIAGVMFIGALGILLYTGSEVMIVKARALWHTEWMIVNLALTAFMASLAAIVFTQARILAATPGDQRLTVRLFVLALIATGVGPVGWAVTGWISGSVSFQAFLRLVEQFAYWRIVFALSVAVGGGLLLAALWMLRTPRGIARAWWLAPLALLAAWSFRWAVLMDVQSVPKYGAGLYPYHLPLGSDGLLGILGVFGLWLAVLMILPGIIANRGAVHPNPSMREVAHG